MENISVKTYTVAGKEAGAVQMPGDLWNLPWNADLVHQVVTGMQSNARASTAHTKGRGDVRGGGKKPWRQKGTGRARHGSSRSPIWVGGGTTHGPNADKNYTKKINKKMKIKALLVSLSQKLRDDQIVFVDDLALATAKTKDAQSVLNGLEKVKGFETLNTKKHNNIFVVVPEKTAALVRAFRNIPHATLEDVRNLNPVEVMNYRYFVIANPEAINVALAAKGSKETASEAKAPKAKKVASKKTSAKKAK